MEFYVEVTSLDLPFILELLWHVNSLGNQTSMNGG